MNTPNKTDKRSLDSVLPATQLNFLQMCISVLASFLGVQSDKNRERDFQQGKPVHFIAVGVVMTALWYLGIYLIVQIVLRVV